MYLLPPTISLEEFANFRDRVHAAREVIQKIGYGAQAQIAFDTRMNASRISNVLRCKAVDDECLERIEAWVRMQSVPVRSTVFAVEDLEEATV
jgi:hypothetical protein